MLGRTMFLARSWEVGPGIYEWLRRSTHGVIAVDTLGDLPTQLRMIMPFLAQIASHQTLLSINQSALSPWVNETI